MKVICCTMFSPSHQELADISVPNLAAYCERHGYEMRIINIADDEWVYMKHWSFNEYFIEGVDLIWYKDVDSLIMDMNKPITDYIDDVYSFFITMDFNELNGGSVVLRNTHQGISFNHYILNERIKFENEQNCYNDPKTLDTFADTINVIRHPSINSYDYSCYPECKEYIGREDLGDWHPGNLMIHFPGLGLKDRVELMKEYSKKVIE